MAVETRLFLDDKMHSWKEGPSISAASTTAEGDKENVRDTTFGNYWKPAKSSSEYVEVSGASQGWLGTTGGATIYCAIAYDARDSDISGISLVRETSEGSGVWTSTAIIFTLNKTAPTCDLGTFPLSSGGRTKYRLYQTGGSAAMAKIHAWSFFTAFVTVKPDPGASRNAFTPHPSNWAANAGLVYSPGGFPFTGRTAAMQQDFHLNSRRIQTKAVWAALVDAVRDAGATARNFYLQFDGIKNVAKADFAMVRLAGARWSAGRPGMDNFDVTIPMLTEAHQ